MMKNALRPKRDRSRLFFFLSQQSKHSPMPPKLCGRCYTAFDFCGEAKSVFASILVIHLHSAQPLHPSICVIDPRRLDESICTIGQLLHCPGALIRKSPVLALFLWGMQAETKRRALPQRVSFLFFVLAAVPDRHLMVGLSSVQPSPCPPSSLLSCSSSLSSFYSSSSFSSFSFFLSFCFFCSLLRLFHPPPHVQPIS